MGAQCHHHVGAQLDERRFLFPVAPSPSEELRSVERTSKSGRTCAIIPDLAGAAHTGSTSAAAPLRGPRLPGCQPHSIFLRSRLPTCPLSYSWSAPHHRRSCGRNLQLADFGPTTDISVEGTEIADAPKDNATSVYLYIPNIIGYMRILMNFVAFTLCFTNKKLFVVLYFISFVLDGLDGWFARRLNQVSTLGAALDMVTDRFTLMVVYITLFLLAEKQPENMISVVVNTMKQRTLFLAPFLFALLGWATKQAVNILQPNPPVIITRESPYTLLVHLLEIDAGVDVFDCMVVPARRRQCDVYILDGSAAVSSGSTTVSSGSTAISSVSLRQLGGLVAARNQSSLVDHGAVDAATSQLHRVRDRHCLR
ncbi:hypothetical protein Taro_010334, partial [Colocasia esculenta]|nr:hypothetical protein [Colocasia esculenta]